MVSLKMTSVPEASPVGESQSNGMVESGVKIFKERMRVHLLALERKIGGKIPARHPIMCWLIEHAWAVISKYLVGHDDEVALTQHQ